MIARAISGLVDNDPETDTWWVGVAVELDVAVAACAEAQQGPSGIPVNLYNDVNCP